MVREQLLFIEDCHIHHVHGDTIVVYHPWPRVHPPIAVGVTPAHI